MSFIAAKIIIPKYEGVCCSGSDTCKVSLYTEADVFDGVWLVFGGGKRRFPAASSSSSNFVEGENGCQNS